jgi:hypothetical protein
LYKVDTVSTPLCNVTYLCSLKGAAGSSGATASVVSTTANGLAPKVTDTCGFLRGDGVWTTNTTGASDLSNCDGPPSVTEDGKIYLVGAAYQTANETTFSNQYVYIDTVTNILHTQVVYQSSDERLKTFTEDYDINLDNIKNIKTGKFYWNSDNKQRINGGVSAQTVEEYFPELVSEDKNGIKSVNYDGLAVVAIAAIKKLTERIEQLEDIIRNK